MIRTRGDRIKLSIRERILTAAEEVMRTKGLARSTTKEIARASGFSEATLYKHFANQEELFLAVLGERLPGFIALLLKDLPARVGRATVPRNLQDVARAAVAFYGQVIPLSGALFSEPVLLAHHRQMLLQKGAGPHRAIEALATYIRAEQRLGRASQSVSPEAISAMLLARASSGPGLRFTWIKSYGAGRCGGSPRRSCEGSCMGCRRQKGSVGASAATSPDSPARRRAPTATWPSPRSSRSDARRGVDP